MRDVSTGRARPLPKGQESVLGGWRHGGSGMGKRARLPGFRIMPPVANPNPDRARRGASTGEAKDEIVPEPLLPVGAERGRHPAADGVMRVACSE